MMRVLVTRAEDQAEETARHLRDRGFEPLLAPLGAVVSLPVTLSGTPPACFVATSRNAFPALAIPEPWRSVPLVAVGDATAAAARAAGFGLVEVAAGDAASAARLVLARHAGPIPVLYLAGHPRKPDLEASLRAAGQACRVIETYHVTGSDDLPGEVVRRWRDGEVEYVLHFSAGSARRCIAALRKAELAVGAARHLALSAEIADCLRAAGIVAARIAVAASPVQESLLDLLPRTA